MKYIYTVLIASLALSTTAMAYGNMLGGQVCTRQTNVSLNYDSAFRPNKKKYINKSLTKIGRGKTTGN